MKVSIVGAGNVGSTLAERVLAGGFADVTLVDIFGDIAKAKALDISDASPVMGYDKHISGTDDYSKTTGSDVAVITAGFPRKPGMSREDLINKNADIVRSAAKNIKKYSPKAIIVIVTNPLDIMTYLAYLDAGRDRKRVFGMAGNLDASRFRFILAEKLGISPQKIEAFVLGSHGDSMLPIVSKAFVNGKPLEKVLDKKTIDEIVGRTKKRGGEIVGLLKSGSAYFSPSAACFEIVKAIAKDEKKTLACSCVLEGEYGIDGCAVGVPVKIGHEGIKEILKWNLTSQECKELSDSAELTKAALKKLT